MPQRRIEQAEPLDPEAAAIAEDKRLLQLRKEIELECVKTYDVSPEANNDFWFMMDTKWLNRWADFVENEISDEPGLISTYEMLDIDMKPIEFLKPRIDYRGVCPMVYYILREFHGKDDSPELCRYTVDIHAVEVLEKDFLKVQVNVQKKATAEAKRLRQKWTKMPPPDVDDQRIDCCGCCYLTREHIEAMLYWMFCCCARRKDGRKDIKYSDYMPLRSKKKKIKNKKQKKIGSVSEFDFDDDDGMSVLDDSVSIGNAEEGHASGGHWLRSMMSTRNPSLK